MRLEKVFCTTKASYISRSRPAAPWSNPPLSQNEVPAVLLIQWRQAENRSTCAA